jgi:hypothetical protein
MERSEQKGRNDMLSGCWAVGTSGFLTAKFCVGIFLVCVCVCVCVCVEI